MTAATVMPAASTRRAPRKKEAPATAPPATPGGSPAVRNIPLELLDDHPDNPRSSLTGIDELAATIQLDGGLLQALVVVPRHRLFGDSGVDDGRYVIAAGHRRRAAVAQLGWTEVKCEVREDLDAKAIRGVMLTENLSRVGLTPLEEAEAFDKLVGDGWSQRDIAAAAGCTQPQVSKRLSLLRLEPTVQAAVREDQLSVAEAVEIGKLKEPRSQKRAYERMRGAHGRSMPVVDALRDEERELAREERYEQACAQVDASGWPRATSRPSYATAEDLRRPKELAAHQKGPLACYAVYVEIQGGISHYCVAPKRHSGRKAKDTSPQAEKERRDKRERKRAMDARGAAAAGLATVAMGPSDLLEQLSDIALTGGQMYGDAELAAEWLRPSWPGLPTYGASSYVARSGDEKLRSRFLGAMVLAHRERCARDQHRRWGRQEALYLHRLTLRTQYSPTEWERERLREHCVVLDVDAFLGSVDPLPHLPEWATLHDDLGTEPATQTVQVDGELL